MSYFKDKRTVAAALGIFFPLLVGVMAIMHMRNERLLSILDEERLRYERLLSEKLSLEKALVKSKKKTATLTRLHIELTKELKDRGTMIEEQQKENQTLRKSLKNVSRLKLASERFADSVRRVSSEMKLSGEPNTSVQYPLNCKGEI